MTKPSNKNSSAQFSNTLILIRFVVGFVFLSEGIQKFLFPELRGVGRFESIGLPWPEFLGYWVASFEVLCGLAISLGFLTRLAVIPTIIIMLVAFATTKSQVFYDKGFWELMHGSRTDWAMLLCSIYLLIHGSGKWSLDKILFGKK
jgi:putative oxidoreductase